MKTNIKTTLFSPKTLAVMGLCIAMTVVLDKFVMIPVGSAIRIGLGALPVIFASIYISPVAGAITALIADLLGCVLAGYTINPVVTLGFVLTAFLSGIFYNYVFVKLPLTLRLFLSIIPAAAFLWFYETKCDIVVLEVGLGGRYDSTNVIKNCLLSVITGIAFDHTEILGDTIEKIAWEKAGIIKESCPALYGGNDEKALAVIEKECEEKHSELTVKNPDLLKILSTTLDGTEFEFDGKEYFIRLLGLYQPANAATVLAAIDVLRKHGFEISETAVKDGLSSAVWQARFEKIADEPVVLYDGGHNPQGVRAAVESVRAYFGDKKINLLVGILADKAHGEMAEELAKIADRVICIAPPSPRALPAESLAEEFCEAGANARAANSIKEGVKIALSYKKPVLVIGSLYSYNDVSESVRNTLKG